MIKKLMTTGVRALMFILGVMLVGFLLMVYFAPDQTYSLAGERATAAEIAQIRESLGYNQGFFDRFRDYVLAVLHLDFGYSNISGQQVAQQIKASFPITLMLVLPGFILGNLIALGLAFLTAAYKNTRFDRFFLLFAVLGMSLSFVVIVIGMQTLFCSPDWLNWFPSRGWRDATFGQYFSHVTVPTLTLALISFAYNSRFYRALVIEELGKPYILTERAYGIAISSIFCRSILKNISLQVMTRILFSFPAITLGGSLLLEKQFGIPGIGMLIFDAITNGDLPILKAIVAMASVFFAVIIFFAERLYKQFDPRLRQAT